MLPLLLTLMLAGSVSISVVAQGLAQPAAYEHDPEGHIGAPGQQITPPAERHAYEQEVEARLLEWKQRVTATAAELQKQADGGPQEPALAALTEAWHDATAAFQQLEEAPPLDWEQARSRMDAAYAELEQAWQAVDNTGAARQPAG